MSEHRLDFLLPTYRQIIGASVGVIEKAHQYCAEASTDRHRKAPNLLRAGHACC